MAIAEYSVDLINRVIGALECASNFDYIVLGMLQDYARLAFLTDNDTDDDTIRIDIEQYNNALDLYANNEKRIKKHIGRGMNATQYIDEGRGMELVLDALGIDYSPIEDEIWGE